MSWTTKQYATAVVVVVLLASIPLVWQVSDARTAASPTGNAAPAKTVTARQAAGDYDGDGVPDDADRCPTRPETRNGFQDGDGCPDTVATTGAS